MSDLKYTLLIEAEADTKGVSKLQKEFSALYKEQKKASSTAAASLIKQQAKTKELNKLTGPAATKLQLAAKKEELRLEKQLTDEVKKQTTARRQLVAANKLAERTTFRGGARRALGMRQSGDPEGPNWRSRMGAAAGGAFRAGIGLAGGGLTALAMAPISAMSAQYQAYAQYQRSLAGLSGMTSGSPFAGGNGLTGESLRGVLGRGASLGFNPEDVVQGVHGMGRAVGSNAEGTTEFAMNASRSSGLDMAALTNMFGEQRRGAGGFGGTQMHEFQHMLQAAVTAGMDQSTLPEAMEGVQQLLQGANTRGGATSGVPYMQLLSMMGSSGLAGLQGARGAAVAGSMEQSVIRAGTASGGGPGDEDAIRMMMLNQAGYGDGASIFEARRRADLGFQEGGIGVQGYGNVVSQLRSSMGDEAARDTMASYQGVTQNVMQEIFDMFDNGASEGSIRERLTRATESELDVMHSINDHIVEFLHGAARTAGIAVEDIDAGADLAEPLETLADIMRTFIHDMRDPLLEVLTPLPDLLRGVTTAVSGLVNLVMHPGNVFSGDASDAIFDLAQEETSRGLRTYGQLQRGEEVSDEDISMAIADLSAASEQVEAAYADSTIRARRQTVEGRASQDQVVQQVRETAIERLIAAFEARTPAATTVTLAPATEAALVQGSMPIATPSSTGGAP